MKQNKEFLNRVDETVSSHGFSQSSHPVFKTIVAAGLVVSCIALASKLKENYVNNFKSYKLSKKS